MFPALMLLSNLAGRMTGAVNHALASSRDETGTPPIARFDFSDARDAYERHTAPDKDMRVTRSVFRKRR